MAKMRISILMIMALASLAQAVSPDTLIVQTLRPGLQGGSDLSDDIDIQMVNPDCDTLQATLARRQLDHPVGYAALPGGMGSWFVIGTPADRLTRAYLMNADLFTDGAAAADCQIARYNVSQDDGPGTAMVKARADGLVYLGYDAGTSYSYCDGFDLVDGNNPLFPTWKASWATNPVHRYAGYFYNVAPADMTFLYDGSWITCFNADLNGNFSDGVYNVNPFIWYKVDPLETDMGISRVDRMVDNMNMNNPFFKMKAMHSRPNDPEMLTAFLMNETYGFTNIYRDSNGVLTGYEPSPATHHRNTIWMIAPNAADAATYGNSSGYGLPIVGGVHRLDSDALFVDIDSLSTGEWVVTYNDVLEYPLLTAPTQFGNGHIEILNYVPSPDPYGWGTFEVVSSVAVPGKITTLNVQSNNDMVVGDANGVLRRYRYNTITETFSLQSSLNLGQEIEQVTVLIGDSTPHCGQAGTIYSEGDLSGPQGMRDCYVDFYDLKVMADNWLNCTNPNDSSCVNLEVPVIVQAPTAISVDGDLSEWANAKWINLNVLDQSTALDGDVGPDGAKMAMYWNGTQNRIYIAVKVTDTDLIFEHFPTDWNTSDRVEIFCQGLPSSGNGDYSACQTFAQQYMVGIDQNNHNSVWSVFGPQALYSQNTGIGGADLLSAGRVNGNEIIYEIGVKVYDNYAGICDGTTSVSSLSANRHVRVDVVVDSRFYSEFMSDYAEEVWQANSLRYKFSIASSIQEYELVTSGTQSCGDWGFSPYDINGTAGVPDCYINFLDIAVVAEDWMRCTDPANPAQCP